MAKRSIDDHEIALIKGMLALGMKNKDIQFHFNRPDRPVNSGRITGIREGEYGRSAAIAPASAAQVESYMASQTVIAVPARSEIADPLDETLIRSLFAERGGAWHLAGGETDRHECKTSFGMKHPGAWLRALAALANNAGGYVFFGVRDAPADGAKGQHHEVVGLATDEFSRTDPAVLARRVKSVFDPTPAFRTRTLTFAGRTVGVMYVERHRSRPVMATRQDGERIGEGDIFFRYPGQSARIKYSDLRAMLDARDAEARAEILPMVERLLTLGPARSMVADLEGAVLGDGRTSIRIDEELARKLTFIKEGEFTETAGAPALRLVGDVETVGTAGGRFRRGVITRTDLLRDFLDRQRPEAPREYIRYALEAGQGEWLPLHYYGRLAGLSQAALIEFIDTTKGKPDRKRSYISRLSGDAAFHASGAKPRLLLPEILAGRLPPVETATQAGHVGQALQALPRVSIDEPIVLDLLKRALETAESDRNGAQASHVRRAICRVDEVLYADAKPRS